MSPDGGRASGRTDEAGAAAEPDIRFNLSRALTHGTVPTVAASADPDTALAAYAALYVEQVVRAEGLVRDIGSFSRFLEAAAFSHAATLNVSEVARECEISRSTVAGYLELLEDLLLSFRLPVFTRRAKRRLVSHPRFFYFDTGVFRSLRPHGPLDRPREIDGAALEGLVAQHLRAWLAWSNEDATLHYWRTRSGSEVDFVVYGTPAIWGIDVMNADRIRPADLRGLRAFGDEYGPAERVLLYRGEHRLVRNGVRCVPVKDFLLKLNPERPLEEAVGKG